MKTLLLLISFFLFGCAPQPPRIAETASGNPEIVIGGVDLESVRSRLIDRVLSSGMHLDSETPSRITVSRELTGAHENLMRLALGNSYSTPVRAETAYTIINVQGGVKIYAQSSAWTQMPGGQVNRMALDGNADFNAVQRGLNSLRDSFGYGPSYSQYPMSRIPR